ncbi:CMP-sialic acid transporter 3 isoform X2 [Brassica rapa]|uniref:CMP-sialic acid transporter 3 isoform X2 n=1 Tax=Brassica campestris TaxID=3711 RepID=UPI00142D363F|nr:CMP-sialic acid transporter 3 isoform X2 [Brassica rapa]XP_033146032.1 CMP-sialic acid transporter 3 isoform X2 [Brassica rapa]
MDLLLLDCLCSSCRPSTKKLGRSHFYLFQHLSRQLETMCFLLFQPCCMQSITISSSQCREMIYCLRFWLYKNGMSCVVQQMIFLLYFNPATVKMLSNLKVLVIAVLLKMVMKRRFSIIQWEALALLLIGISVNQLRSLPEGATAIGIPLATGAYICTIIFVTVPSMASVFNEYALKSQYDTSIYLQNLFLYGYGAIFNFIGILATVIYKGPESFDILQGHSRATVFLIMNNAAQGILSSFFFKYADTILKKYSSTVATIFTGIASAALFGHVITMNFLLGISIVFISMHQFFSPLAKVKDEHQQNGSLELSNAKDTHRADDSFINMAAGANEEATQRGESDDRTPLLPR